MDTFRNFGNLYIKLTAKAGSRPPAGALIQAAKGGVIVSSCYADVNGEVNISLPSFDYRRSLSPGPSSLPYSPYDVRVSHTGHIPALFKGVQIFPGATTVIRHLLKRADEGYGKKTQTVLTPPHRLMAGVPIIRRECDVTPLRTERANSEVKLPLCVTVHLGQPKSDAENVTVDFLTYIKNVAANEIYPTWPEEAIKANIIAAVSSALNRITQRRYRVLGYPFDITNAPEVDQPYVHGGPTFHETDKIADRVFYLYGAKSGEDGSLFLCRHDDISAGEGLSQWGSVELAKQNYDAESILRYYFGGNITVSAAQTEENSKQAVSQGQKTDKDIYSMLNHIAAENKNGEIPFTTCGGRASEPEKSAALAAFQSSYGLDVTGSLDETTRRLISYVYSALRFPAAGEAKALSAYPGYPLGIGDRSESVVRASTRLAEIAEHLGEDVMPEVFPAMVFDGGVRNGVAAFQKYINLCRTGVIDKETWEALESFPLPAAVKEAPAVKSGVIRFGDSGESVREAQGALNKWLRENQSGEEIPEDGRFGGQTKKAVLDFQKSHGLLQDGVIGPETWAKLKNPVAEPPEEPSVG
ncbi:MAG: peptidoglycan-binding protein [Eubacteriales bacterium]